MRSHDFEFLAGGDDDAAIMRKRGLGKNLKTLIDQRPGRVRTKHHAPTRWAHRQRLPRTLHP